ncbi:MAG: hypothetical protein ACK502_09295 [Alphaproteobacteria bacterium]
MDQGYDSFGASGASATTNGGREHFGGTSNFNTIGLSEDGRFFGVKLSQETASQLRTFYPAFLDWARRKGEQYGVPLAEKFAAKALDYKPHELGKFRGTAQNVIGYGIILSNQLLDVSRNIYDSAHSLGELNKAVKPLSQSAGSGSLSGNNEVIANARKKIDGVFWSKLLNTVTGTIATTPALMTKWNEQKAKIDEHELQHAIKDAKGNSDKLADVLQKKISGGTGHTELEGADMRIATEKLLDREREAYKKRMEKFVKDNKREVEKELKDVAKDIKVANIRSKIRELKHHGVDTSILEKALREGYDRRVERHVGISDERTAAAIKEFEGDMKHSLEHYVDEAVKTKFVRQNGAFDDEQAYLLNKSGGLERKTIKEEIERKIHDIGAKQKKPHEEEKPHDPNSIGAMAAGLGAGFVAEMATNAFSAKKLEKYEQPVALDLILHLRRELEKAGDACPEMVPGIRDSKQYDRDMSYAQFVHKIFQEHQQDCGRNQIGGRFVEHLEGARWDDAAIQSTPDDQLNAYELAVKTISKRIKDGRMDAIALVGLVGDKRKKIVQDDGRNFGPRGTAKTDEAQKKAIMKIIDEHTIMVHAGHHQSDEQVHANLGDLVFSVDDMKAALTSPDMEPQQRSFIFTVFSNIVGNDETLGKMVGLNAEQIKTLRAESTANFNQLLDAAISVMADMLDQNPQGLDQKIKLTANEKDIIRSLAGRMQQEGKDVADLAANREEVKLLETAVANAAMVLDKNAAGHLEGKKPDSFWQKVVAATKKPKAPVVKQDPDMSMLAREESRRAAPDDMQETMGRG